MKGNIKNENKMNTFFTADLHLGHANIIKYCNRPFRSVEEMDSTIINNWNSVVTPDDYVYILGDLSFNDHLNYLHRLNGKKALIIGNHDKLSIGARQTYTFITPLTDIRHEGQRITLCHYPMLAWNGSFHGSWHLYGHVHGNSIEQEYKYSCDVGTDIWNYFPVSFETIKKKMATKVQEFDFNSQEAQAARNDIRDTRRSTQSDENQTYLD
jgi:calcineurin-like phosphoesterase family protein